MKTGQPLAGSWLLMLFSCTSTQADDDKGGAPADAEGSRRAFFGLVPSVLYATRFPTRLRSGQISRFCHPVGDARNLG